MRKNILYILLGLCSLAYAGEEETCFINKVISANTLVCGKQTVRLSGVHVPAPDSPLGRVAKKSLETYTLGKLAVIDRRKINGRTKIFTLLIPTAKKSVGASGKIDEAYEYVDVQEFLLNYGYASAQDWAAKEMPYIRDAQRNAIKMKRGVWAERAKN